MNYKSINQSIQSIQSNSNKMTINSITITITISLLQLLLLLLLLSLAGALQHFPNPSSVGSGF